MSTSFALDTPNFIKISILRHRSITSYLKMNKNSGQAVYCNLKFYNSFASQFVTFDFRFLLLMSFLCLIKWLQRNNLYTIRKVFKQALKWYITWSISKIFYLRKTRSNHAQFLLLLGILSFFPRKKLSSAIHCQSQSRCDAENSWVTLFPKVTLYNVNRSFLGITLHLNE